MDKLCNVAEANDIHTAKDILQNSKNIDLTMRVGNDQDYTTLLILACEEGHTHRKITDFKAKVSSRCKYAQ